MQLAAGIPLRLFLCVMALVVVAKSALGAIKYEPKITGVFDRNLLDDLRVLSQLVQLKDKPPDTVAGLRQRAEADLERLKPAVEGAGFWEAELTLSIDEAKDPIEVEIRVEPGPLYLLADVTLVQPDGSPAPRLLSGDPAAFGLAIGQPAKSGPILDAEPKIAEAYGNEARPFARVVNRKVVVDRATKTLSVTYIVEAGPKLRFGPVDIKGLARVDRGFVERRIAWLGGTPYYRRDVEATRQALVDSGLFATVKVEPVGPPMGEEVPIAITVSERAPRSIGAGVNYDTTQGFGANASWEHRNLFGGGESLLTSTQLSEQRLAALGRFRKPDFYRTDQSFIAEAELSDEMPDPYDSRKLRGFAGIERKLFTDLTLGGGLQMETATVRQKALFDSVPPRFDYTLVSLPFYLRRDTSDDQLNPTRGNRETLTITPYGHLAGTSGRDVNFLTIQGRISGYQHLDADNRFVLAGFAGIGSIEGAHTEELPADKRLYLGGGGSVRGYGYQRVGPLAGSLPTGGISSLEIGTELRLKVTDTIGLVPFVEAGNVYRGRFPNLDSRLFVGTGIGLRYYTPIGPVRLDVATPLMKRSSDNAVQIYVSVGQAF